MTVALQIFRVIAACASLFMLLSPAPMVYKMHKNRDTGVMSVVPLLAVLVNANMWMMYGYLDRNYVPVFVTFLAGEIIALSYVGVFYRWTKNRASVHSVMAIAALVVAATSLYVILAGYGVTGQTRHEAAQVAGILSDITGMIMYASPLAKVVHVFKHKSAVFIPIHMVCMGSTNNAIWITYSLLAKKWIIFIPCVCAFVLGVFQMVLYFVVYHPATHPLREDTDATASGTAIVSKDALGRDDGEPLSITIETPTMSKGMENSTLDFTPLASPRGP